MSEQMEDPNDSRKADRKFNQNNVEKSNRDNPMYLWLVVGLVVLLAIGAYLYFSPTRTVNQNNNDNSTMSSEQATPATTNTNTPARNDTNTNTNSTR